jgi:hypothetical protein
MVHAIRDAWLIVAALVVVAAIVVWTIADWWRRRHAGR